MRFRAWRFVMTAHPADATGVRPVERYAYAQRYAWIKNAAGVYLRADAPIWVRTGDAVAAKRAPRLGNACAAGVADEVITSYDYGPDLGAE